MFVKKPRSSEAFEGDMVIIMCEVIGDPKPEVVWLRDFLKVIQLSQIHLELPIGVKILKKRLVGMLNATNYQTFNEQTH